MALCLVFPVHGPIGLHSLVTQVITTVDCTITADHAGTWHNYSFGHFSNCVQVFAEGSGVVRISSRNKLLPDAHIPLTPGPLVVALIASPTRPGHLWPPLDARNIEAIAASYDVPPALGNAGMRLFLLVNTTGDPVLDYFVLQNTQ